MASKQTKGSLRELALISHMMKIMRAMYAILIWMKTNICVLFPTSITSARTTAMVMNIWL